MSLAFYSVRTRPAFSPCRTFFRQVLRTSVLATMLGIFGNQHLYAEGTRQVAPAPSDIVMLLTTRIDFSNFAAFNGPADSRLYITVNSAAETIHLGLSGEFNDSGNPFRDADRSRYRFRIRRATGSGNDPVVHGPFIIDYSNANVRSWTDAQFGEYLDTLTINGRRVFSFTPGQTGDYYIEFQDVGDDGNAKVLIGYWDITVAENGSVKPGRVWSRNWAFRTPVESNDNPDECLWDRKFNGTLFSYTTDGFVSKIDFKDSGFQGLAFTVSFNATGPGSTGDPAEDRKSIEGRNATDNSAQHQIFLNEPDPLVFPDGECGSVSSAPNFQCSEDGFCLPVSVSRPGQVEVILDFNQDGDFDPDSKDVSLLYCFEGSNLSACVPWDGLRGDSTAVESGDTIDIILIYTQGVQHWAVYDAEFLKNGFCVEAVRPLCGTGGNLISGKLYWDDRNILPEPGTGQPKDGRNGCQCGTDGCRTWNNFSPNTSCDQINDSRTTGYGDKSTINTWWFANIRTVTKGNIPLLTCMITGRDTICEGETTEFTAEASSRNGLNYTFSWSGPGDFSSASQNTGPIDAPGEYSVTITDPFGCQSVCSRTLVVNDRPTLNLVSIANASCESAEDGVINVSAQGGSGSFSYSIDGVSFQAAPTFTGLPPGEYLIRVADGAACRDSLSVAVGFEPLPEIDFPDRLTACAGEAVQAPPSGPADLFYEWTPADGIDDPNSPTPVFSPDRTTTYIVGASKTADRICTAFDTLIVEVVPGPVLTLSGDTVSCNGQVALNVSADVPASFTWLSATGEILATGPELILPIDGDAVISVRAEDDNGCTSTRPIRLVDASLDLTVPVQVEACLGEELGISVVNNNPGDQLTYSWTPVEAFLPGTANTANPILTQEVGERTVFVTVESERGCSYTDSVKAVLVDPDLELDFTTILQCNGATVEFTNTSTNAFGYLWDFGDPGNPGASSKEVNPVYTYTEAGTYRVTLTIQYNVSCTATVSQDVVITNTEVIADFNYQVADCTDEGATIAFTDASMNDLNNTVSWLWEFSTGETSTLQDPSLVLTQSTELAVKLTIGTANGCLAMKTDTIDFILPSLELQEEITLCPGASVILNPGGDPSLEYSWSPAEGLSDPAAASPVASPQQSTIYTVKVKGVDAETCELTDQVAVVITPAVELTVSDDQVTCGEDATLSASANVPVTFEWRNSKGALVGTGSTITVNPSREEVYIVSATDENGCVAVDSVKVTDQGVDVELASPPGDVAGCGPQEVAVEVVNEDPEDVLIFDWKPAAFVSDPSVPNPLVLVESGTVTISTIIENQYGCRDSVAFTVTAVDFDPALPDTVFVCAGEQKALSPEADPAYQYLWSPADGLDDPTSPNPLFTGTESTSYRVTVSGSSGGQQCEVVRTVEVIVRPAIALTTTPDTVLCAPSEITLRAGSDLEEVTFTWFDAPSLDDKIGEGPQITLTPPLGTSIFYVLAEDSRGCTEPGSVEVTMVTAPEGPAETVNVCADTPAELNPEGDPDLQYEWDPVAGLDLAEPWNPIVTTGTDVTYQVTITNPANGCVYNRQVEVLANPSLNLQLSPDTTLCEVSQITLRADTEAPASVRWYDNPEFSGAPLSESRNLTITPAVGATTYYVIAYDGAACTETAQVTVVVREPFESGLPGSVAGCPGLPIVLPLDPGLTYRWSPETGLDLSDPTQAVITVSADISYQVTVTDPATGCFLTEELTVDVSPALNLSVTPARTTLCEPAPVVLRASTTTPANFTWYDNPDLTPPVLGTGSELTVTPQTGTSTYYVVAQGLDECGETAVASAVVTVLDLLGDSGLPGTVNGCLGDEVTLTLNDAYSYEWAPIEGLDLGDPAKPVITISENRSYDVTVTEPATGCQATASLEVAVSPSVRVTVAPADTTLCEPAPLLLTATADGPAGFSWYDNPDLSGPPVGTGPTLSVSPPLGPTTYYVLAQGTGECPGQDVASATVNVVNLPDSTGLPGSRIDACEGDRISLQLNPRLLYQWDPTTGLDLSDPANPVISATQDITYTLNIEDPATGCTASTPFEVDVHDPVVLTLTPEEITLCEPEPVTITAETGGAATVSWFSTPDLSGEPVFVGNSYSFTPPPGASALFVLAQGTAGCTRSDTAVVEILVQDPFDDAGLPQGPVQACPGDTVGIELAPAFDYQWSPTTGIDLSDPKRPVFTIGDPVTYDLLVTDPVTGCTLDLKIDAGPYPPVGLVLSPWPDTLLCGPGTVEMEASTSRPAVISWYDNPDFDGPPLGSGNVFSVRIEGDTLTYYVQAVSEEGCTESDSIIVAVKDLIAESGLDDLPDTTLTVCAGDPATLSLNGAFDYQWDPTDGIDLSDPANPVFTVTEDRTYSVTVTDPLTQCSATAQLKVRVNPLLNLTVSEGDTLCTPEEIILAAGTDIEATFEWSADPGFDPVLSTGAEFAVVPPLGATVYYVRATDATELACISIDSVRIDVHPVDAGLPSVISCEPADELTLEVVNNAPGQVLTYLWFPEGAVISDPTSGPAAVVDPAIATDYSVDLLNQYGCTATLTATARVIYLSDSLDISADPDTILPGESSRLEVTGCADCSYDWSPPATLDRNDIPNPVATPAATTQYDVIVEKEGCLDTLAVTVTVEEFECGYPYVYLPNAFTPNNDGVNDLLFVRGRNITRMKLMIFNRWGQKLFESISQDVGWDGIYQEQQLPPDVYGFYLEVQCGDGETYQSQGNVTLLR